MEKCTLDMFDITFDYLHFLEMIQSISITQDTV